MPPVPRHEVLIVDDFAGVTTLAKRILRDYVRVAHAESCEDALTTLGETPGRFDVVILDMAFPKDQLQGEDALREIKRWWPQQEVVVLSVSEPEELERKCHGYQGVSWLTKDGQMVDLLPALVVAAIERTRARTRQWFASLAPRTAAASSPTGDSTAAARVVDEPRGRDPSVPGDTCAAPPTAEAIATLDELLREHITKTLAATSRNIRQAASLLGVHYSHLRRLIKRLKVPVPPTPEP